ncbi:MAG: hypothetical protein ACI8Z1_000056 [Candidatus Azotimanducaceae bacterium]|jgi:hypothetical protein
MTGSLYDHSGVDASFRQRHVSLDAALVGEKHHLLQEWQYPIKQRKIVQRYYGVAEPPYNQRPLVPMCQAICRLSLIPKILIGRKERLKNIEVLHRV